MAIWRCSCTMPTWLSDARRIFCPSTTRSPSRTSSRGAASWRILPEASRMSQYDHTDAQYTAHPRSAFVDQFTFCSDRALSYLNYLRSRDARMARILSPCRRPVRRTGRADRLERSSHPRCLFRVIGFREAAGPGCGIRRSGYQGDHRMRQARRVARVELLSGGLCVHPPGLHNAVLPGA